MEHVTSFCEAQGEARVLWAPNNNALFLLCHPRVYLSSQPTPKIVAKVVYIHTEALPKQWMYETTKKSANFEEKTDNQEEMQHQNQKNKEIHTFFFC